MHDQDRSSPAKSRRPLSAAQERLFFAAVFVLGICLQLTAVLLQAGAAS
ncbi:MAG: hypothetical protein AB7S71_12500 [Dongiaceae bacterium]